MTKKEDFEQTVVELSKNTAELAKTIKRIDAKRHWAIYSHPWRFFIFSFLNGLLIVLGSTLGVALVLYLLSLLGYLPYVGTFFSGLRETIY